MTRATYTKPNSYAQVSGRKALCTVDAVCLMLDISGNEWIEIMFEYGCKYAELKASSPEMAYTVLTDQTLNFWSQWITEYVRDDEELLSIHAGTMSLSEYKKLKDQFI